MHESSAESAYSRAFRHATRCCLSSTPPLHGHRSGFVIVLHNGCGSYASILLVSGSTRIAGRGQGGRGSGGEGGLEVVQRDARGSPSDQHQRHVPPRAPAAGGPPPPPQPPQPPQPPADREHRSEHGGDPRRRDPVRLWEEGPRG